MQKYGKTLNRDRFFPKFYTFASNLTPSMRYFKVIFTVSSKSDNTNDNDMLLQTAKDVLCSLLGDAGFEAFEDNGKSVTGYVQTSFLDRNKLGLCIEKFPIPNTQINYNIYETEDKDWNTEWERNGFEPIYIDNKCIIHDTKHSVADRNKSETLDITIDAKQAFGTGAHDTTQMIVAYLMKIELRGKNILDCGCGTGILSIIASKVGAHSITAYDIDEWSIRNTQHNCAINCVSNVRTMLGDASILDNTAEKFDIVMANINRNVLLADLPSFKKKMANNAMLLLSGFYRQDAEHIIQKAELFKLTLETQQTSNGWCMLVFKAM